MGTGPWAKRSSPPTAGPGSSTGRTGPEALSCPFAPGPWGCVALRQGLGHSEPGTVTLSSFSGPGGSCLAWLPHPSSAGSRVKRGRRLGVGPVASRAPSWVDTGKSQGGKIFRLSPPAPPDPGPHGDLEVTSLLTPAPPASAGQHMMDASWPVLCFILLPEKSERGGSQGSALGLWLEAHAHRHPRVEPRGCAVWPWAGSWPSLGCHSSPRGGISLRSSIFNLWSLCFTPQGDASSVFDMHNSRGFVGICTITGVICWVLFRL